MMSSPEEGRRGKRKEAQRPQSPQSLEESKLGRRQKQATGPSWGTENKTTTRPKKQNSIGVHLYFKPDAIRASWCLGDMMTSLGGAAYASAAAILAEVVCGECGPELKAWPCCEAQWRQSCVEMRFIQVDHSAAAHQKRHDVKLRLKQSLFSAVAQGDYDRLLKLFNWTTVPISTRGEVRAPARSSRPEAPRTRREAGPAPGFGCGDGGGWRRGDWGLGAGARWLLLDCSAPARRGGWLRCRRSVV
jgi:hypothetical protein